MSDNSFEKAWRMAYPNGECCPESRDFCDDQMVIDLAEAYDEIDRLTKELAGVREYAESSLINAEEAISYAEQLKQHIEVAEQEVIKAQERIQEVERLLREVGGEEAVLAEIIERLASMECFTVSRFVDPRRDEELLARIDFARKVFSTLPDRAKKIQAVVEAAKIWANCPKTGGYPDGTSIEDTCENLSQAIRDLES